MCERLLAMRKDGASVIEVCADLGIAKRTYLVWREQRAEFNEAAELGDTLAEAWWTRQGRLNLRDKEFNSTMWYMNMKNRFGWRDKQEHMGAGGGALKIVLSQDDAEL